MAALLAPVKARCEELDGTLLEVGKGRRDVIDALALRSSKERDSGAQNASLSVSAAEKKIEQPLEEFQAGEKKVPQPLDECQAGQEKVKQLLDEYPASEKKIAQPLHESGMIDVSNSKSTVMRIGGGAWSSAPPDESSPRT